MAYCAGGLRLFAWCNTLDWPYAAASARGNLERRPSQLVLVKLRRLSRFVELLLSNGRPSAPGWKLRERRRVHQDFSQSDPAVWLLLITANPSKVLSVLYLSGELVMVIVMSAKMDTEDLDCIMLGWPAFFLLLL
jgi:hypothetical protein